MAIRKVGGEKVEERTNSMPNVTNYLNRVTEFPKLDL
jgi:hypothetical protein